MIININPAVGTLFHLSMKAFRKTKQQTKSDFVAGNNVDFQSQVLISKFTRIHLDMCIFFFFSLSLTLTSLS